ncbi:hypothetical protein [Acidithiobacillus sp.]
MADDYTGAPVQPVNYADGPAAHLMRFAGNNLLDLGGGILGGLHELRLLGSGLGQQGGLFWKGLSGD